MIASTERRRLAVTGVNDDTLKMSHVNYTVLSRIAKSRSDGITQANLARTLNIDNRSLFHYVKQLNGMGLV